jgi:hypothetical protein
MEIFKSKKSRKTIRSTKKIFLKMVYNIKIIQLKKLNKNIKMVNQKRSKTKTKNNLLLEKKKNNKTSFKVMKNLKYSKKKRNHPHHHPLHKNSKNKKWIKKMMIPKNF